MKAKARSGESGFSLAELLVAMAMTLVITGAMYGLLSQGQSAFKREPEVTDRQQNIRVAMDLITRDIANAGQKMGAWTQVFTNGLNGAGAIWVPNGTVNSDKLEMLGSDPTCPDLSTLTGPCPNPANNCAYNGTNIQLQGTIPACYTDDSFELVVFGVPGPPRVEVGAKFGFGHIFHGGYPNEKLNFPNGLNGPASQIQGPADVKAWQPAPATAPYNDPPIGIVHAGLFRYEIAADTDGVPALYRSTSGGMVASFYQPPTPTAAAWQMVARGIEDLQVQYRTGNTAVGAWDPTPGVTSCGAACGALTANEYNTIVRQVQITLAARTQNLRATANVTAGIAAIHGSLTSVATPRAALYYLQQGNQWY